jgi:hypothetical protein
MSFHFLFVIVILVCLERVLSVALKGNLFKPNALRQAFHEVGKTAWLGMRLFVVFWILYLALLYYVQHHR